MVSGLSLGRPIVSMRLVRATVNAEQEDSLHEARILLLLGERAARGNATIDGITKLAKMDFLLRYPVYLQRLLNETKTAPPKVQMLNFEKDTVESKMIRFRYGPWDPRYRRWIGLLVAKGLVETYLKGRTVHVRVTSKGRVVASSLIDRPEFKDLQIRTATVNSAVGGMSGTKLKELIYKVVPELTGMEWGKEIEQ